MSAPKISSDIYYLKRPTQQRFWLNVGQSLKPFGLGSQEWWGLPKPRLVFRLMYLLTIVGGPECFISQIIYFYFHFREFNFSEQAYIFTVITISLAVNAKLNIARKASYKKDLVNFMATTHIYNYKPVSEKTNKILVSAERRCRFTTILLFFVMSLSLFHWTLSPIYNNITNLQRAKYTNETVRLETCIHMIMLVDYEHNLGYWIIVHSINIYFAVFAGMIVVMSDSILFSIVFHLIGRIKIFKYHLEDLAKNYDEYSESQVLEILSNCIRDHVLIKSSFSDLQESFGISVTGTYFVNLLFDSLLLLQFKYGDTNTKVAYSLILVIYFGTLIIMTTIMEQVRIESDTLSNAIYDLPWHRMTISHRRIVLVLLARNQTTLVFKAFGGLEAGINPTISIIKSTFSYYVMLKAKRETIEG